MMTIKLAALFCVIASLAVGEMVSLQVSSASAVAGATVPLYVTLNSTTATPPAALQWDFSTTSGIQAVSTTLGAAGSSAAKSLTCSGSRCIIDGINTNNIPNGTVATLNVTLSSTASGNIGVQLGNVMAATANGNAISIPNSTGTISIAPVSVAVSPATVTLSAGQTQQFTATVSGGSGNPAVTWSLNPSLGSISATGLYTAPASITAQQTVTATATSAADPSKFASASITLTASSKPITFIQSASKAQTSGQSASQAFPRTVTAGDLLIIGTFVDVAAPVSVTDSQGNTFTRVAYQTVAGDHDALVFAGTARSAGADSITVDAGTGKNVYAFSIHEYSGVTATVDASSTAQGNSTAPTSGNLTTSTPNDLIFAWFTNGSNFRNENFPSLNSAYTRREMSGTSTTQCYGVANCVESADIIAATVLTTNATATLNVPDIWSATVIAFKGSAAAARSWPHTISAIDATPQSAGTPPAVSALANSSRTLSTPRMPAVKPKKVSLGALQSQRFTFLNEETDALIRWSLKPPIGMITSDGLYVAPAVLLSPQEVTLTATSTTESYAASATITLLPAAITPSDVELGPGESMQFAATFGGSSDSATTWSIEPAIGTISPRTGLYIAPPDLAAPQILTVTATNSMTPDKSATTTVSLRPQAITPRYIQLGAGQTQQFAADLGHSNEAISWTLTPSIGVVSQTGLYMAPGSLPSSRTVILQASGTESEAMASAIITLRPTSISPQAVNLIPGQEQQFNVVTEDGNPAHARWSIIPQLGLISSTGRYVAPPTVAIPTIVTIIADAGSTPGSPVSAAVTLMPSTPELLKFECSPNMDTALCTVTLSAPAPSAGVDVTLTSLDAEGLAAPDSWHIPGGSMSSSFPVTVLARGGRLTATLGTTIAADLRR